MAMVQQTRANFNPQTLVTPANPNILSADRIEKMANAYAKGALTTEEILKSVGPIAHQEAELKKLVMDRQKEDILDPAKATGRQAVAMQQEMSVKRALNAGAQLPMNEDGSVNFQQLNSMMPAVSQWERAEQDRQSKLEEWQNEFLRFAKSDPTNMRPLYLSWHGDQPLSSEAFNAEGKRLKQPTDFNALFTQGATSGRTGTPQSTIPEAQGGEVFGAATPGSRYVERNVQPQTQQPTVQPQSQPQQQPGAGFGNFLLSAPTPTQAAAQSIGYSVVGTDPSGHPIYGKNGEQKAPSEAEQKQLLARARFVTTPMITELEDLGNQSGGYDITGQWNGFRNWLADTLPNWAPLIGHGSLAEPQQLYNATSRAWIQGVLRLESGAAIPPAEEESYYNAYFAQPGDSRTTVLAKRALRANIEAGIPGALPPGTALRNPPANGQVGNPLAMPELQHTAEVYNQPGNVLNTKASKGNEAAQRSGVSGYDAQTGLPVVQPISGTNAPEQLVQPY